MSETRLAAQLRAARRDLIASGSSVCNALLRVALAVGLCKKQEKLSVCLLSPSTGVLCLHSILVVMHSPGKWDREFKAPFTLEEVFLARYPAFEVVPENIED